MISPLADGDRQLVYPRTSEFADRRVGDSITFDVLYDTMPQDENLSGIGVSMHFDSMALSLDDVANIMATELPLPNEFLIIADSEDGDGDPYTDQMVLFAWAGLEGDWPGETLPAVLFTPSFTVAAGFSEATRINFTVTAAASGYQGETISVDITAAGGSSPADSEPNIIFTTLNGTPERFAVGQGIIAEFAGDTSGHIIDIPAGAGASNIKPGTTVNIQGNSADFAFSRNGTTLVIDDEAGNLVAVLNAATAETSLVRFLDGGSEVAVEAGKISFAGATLANGEAIAGVNLPSLNSGENSAAAFADPPSGGATASNLIVTTLDKTPEAFTIGAGLTVEFAGDTSGHIIDIPAGAGATNIKPNTTVNIQGDSAAYELSRNGTTLVIRDDETGYLAAVLNASSKETSLVRFSDGSSEVGVAADMITFGGLSFADGQTFAGDDLTLDALAPLGMFGDTLDML